MSRLLPLLLFAASCSTVEPDVWIDVQGARVHARVTGPVYAPVVILDGGAGQDLRTWNKVAEELSKQARVVTWSRPGLGSSELGLVGRGSPRIVEELRIVLEALEVEPPYVIVGHSLGSFHARAYAAMYRNEVAAMVLIDPSHEDWLKRLRLTRSTYEWREMGNAFHKEVNLLPEGARREFASLEEDSKRMTRLPTLPEIPVWILSCTRFGEGEVATGRRAEDILLWEELHRELASSMHPNATVEHVTRSDLGQDVIKASPEAVVEGVLWALGELGRR